MADQRIGVTLSGGGHRAAAWGAGAVLGLTDAGVSGDVVSMASVSGGSIANGVVAAGGDLRGGGREDVEGWLRPGLRRWAHDGLFFNGPATDGWVAVTLGLAVLAVLSLVAVGIATLGAGREWTDTGVAWATIVIGLPVMAAAIVGAVKLPGTRIPAAVLAAAALSVPLTYVAVRVATRTAIWLLAEGVVAILVLLVAARRFGGRSQAVVGALDRELFSATPTLASLGDRPVHHVFCATNLRTGNNLYLSNRLVWGHPVVGRRPGDETVATAVQASACLPGGFLARTLDLRDGDSTVRVVLSDGGVYDNMADQWEWGFENRQSYARDGERAVLDEAQAQGATHLVVVNASKGMEGDRALEVRPGLLGEVASLASAINVLYDVSTAPRRRLLVEEFDRAGGLDGMLVHIGTSPYAVVDRFGAGKGPVATRARAAGRLLDLLTDAEGGTTDDDGRRSWWRDVAGANAGVKTTLAPLEELEPGSTARLLHHAWVLTRVTAHVVQGWGRLPRTLDEDWRRARFDELVASSRAGAAGA